VTASGQTVDTSGQPLRKTTLTMRAAKPDLTGVNPSPYGAISGADGTFEFKVTPGNYILTAQHAGYLTASYGGTKPSSRGVTLNVVAGRPMTDLRVALTPASTVTGKVLDEDGDPVERVSIQLLRSVYLSGTRRLTSAGMAGLLGLSRITGSGVVPKESAEPEQQHITTFYPNVRDAASAVLLEVRPAQESDSRPEQISVALMTDAGPGANIGIGIGNPQSTNISADGTFDIAGIAPGAYSLLAVTNYGTIVTLAQQAIVVGARDLQDLVLELRPLGQLAGHVTTETPAEAAGSAGTWARAIMRGGIDVLDSGPDIGSGDNGSALDVRLKRSSAGISGSVQNEDGQAVSGADVIVIPDTNSANRLWMLSRLVSTDQNGRFSFDSLAPGTYRVYAWGEIEPGAGFDPEFVKPYESKSVKVTL